MFPTAARPSRRGEFLIAAAALIGLVLVAVAYFMPHGAIARQWGTLLVLVSTALMLMAALLIARASMPAWLVTTFEVLILLDIAGTSLCAYFLEFYALLVLMAVALLGWALHITARGTQIAAAS
jgi:hypothetical protein